MHAHKARLLELAPVQEESGRVRLPRPGLSRSVQCPRAAVNSKFARRFNARFSARIESPHGTYCARSEASKKTKSGRDQASHPSSLHIVIIVVIIIVVLVFYWQGVDWRWRRCRPRRSSSTNQTAPPAPWQRMGWQPASGVRVAPTVGTTHTHTHTYTHTHAHTVSLSLARALSLSRPLSLSLPRAFTHSLVHSQSPPHPHTRARTPAVASQSMRAGHLNPVQSPRKCEHLNHLDHRDPA